MCIHYVVLSLKFCLITWVSGKFDSRSVALQRYPLSPLSVTSDHSCPHIAAAQYLRDVCIGCACVKLVTTVFMQASTAGSGCILLVV